MFYWMLNSTYLTAICLSLYVIGWLLLRGHKNTVTRAFIFCQLLIILWCLPQIFNSLFSHSSFLFVTHAICYLGISFIGPSWLLFTVFFAGKRLPKITYILLFGISLLHYLMLLTNATHHLFYLQFIPGNIVYGPVFYLHVFYTYLCVLAGLIILYRNFRQNAVRPLIIVLILLSVIVPVCLNTVYLTGLTKFEFDLTPPAFSFSSLLLLIAVCRYDFLNVNTIALDRIFEVITEGLFVFNKRGIITYTNQRLHELLPFSLGHSVDQFYQFIERYDQEMNAQNLAAYHNTLFTLADKTLELKRYLHFDRKQHMIAGTVMVSDVSKYYELLKKNQELAVTNQQLALEKERNRIAQEVHDTAGHTLTMINSLAKLAEIEQDNDYLPQIRQLATEGLSSLRLSINNLRQSASEQLVTQSINNLINKVREIAIELHVQGEDDAIYSPLSPVIYSCLREAITNCLKYAHATRMDLILKFSEKNLRMYIFDNGVGCDKIQKNNGLTGISKRVQEAGGDVSFSSAQGEGFRITLTLPVKEM